MKCLANLFFLSTLLPFVSVYPIQTDVQPTVLVIGIFLLLVDGFRTKFSFQFNSIEITFIAIALLSLIWVNPLAGSYLLRKRIGLAAAFLIFYVARRYHNYFSIKVFIVGVCINFAAAVFHYISPAIFADTFDSIVRIIKIRTMIGARGASGLASEPGFLGAIAIYSLLLLYYFSQRQSIGKLQIICVISMSLAMILLSRSGTGYFFMFLGFIIWSAKYLFSKNRSWLLLLLFFLVLYNVFKPGFGGRGGYVLKKFVQSPQYFLYDSSIAHRVLNITVMGYSIIEYPFGSGAGSYPRVSIELNEKHGFLEYFKTLKENKITANVSALSQYVVEMGIIFVVFLIVIFLDTKFNHFALSCRFFAFLYIVASFSILFPPTWVLLAVSSKRNIYSIKSMKNFSLSTYDSFKPTHAKSS